jgi:hypothetical protein
MSKVLGEVVEDEENEEEIFLEMNNMQSEDSQRRRPH